MIDPALVEQIRKALERATSGPWHVDIDPREDGADQVCYSEGARSFTLAFMSTGRDCLDGEFPDADAELIVLLRNHADELLAALAQAPPTWQPIETAPKDGTRILLYWPHWASYPIIGRWFDNAWDSRWKLEGSDVSPIAWIPLPVAPRPASAAKGKAK